jgi:D-alanyl-D-alanine carboxypeptidase
MNNTNFPSTGNMPTPYAHGYSNQTADGQVADVTLWNPSWAWAAGAMISNLADMKIWATELGKGSLLNPATQKKRLEGTAGPAGTTYGFAIFTNNGWIGHNGSLPGYTTVVVSMPDQNATLVISANTDISTDGKSPADHLANAVTAVATPDHVYGGKASAGATTSASPGPSSTNTPGIHIELK